MTPAEAVRQLFLQHAKERSERASYQLVVLAAVLSILSMN